MCASSAFSLIVTPPVALSPLLTRAVPLTHSLCVDVLVFVRLISQQYKNGVQLLFTQQPPQDFDYVIVCAGIYADRCIDILKYVNT